MTRSFGRRVRSSSLPAKPPCSVAAIVSFCGSRRRRQDGQDLVKLPRTSSPLACAWGNILLSVCHVRHHLAAICEGLLQLLFPRVFTLRRIHSRHLRRVIMLLFDQQRSLEGRSVQESSPARAEVPEESAEELLFEFLEGIPAWCARAAKRNVEAAFQGDPADQFESDSRVTSRRAVHGQRCASGMSGAAAHPQMKRNRRTARPGIDIHPGAEIVTLYRSWDRRRSPSAAHHPVRA